MTLYATNKLKSTHRIKEGSLILHLHQPHPRFPTVLTSQHDRQQLVPQIQIVISLRILFILRLAVKTLIIPEPQTITLIPFPPLLRGCHRLSPPLLVVDQVRLEVLVNPSSPRLQAIQITHLKLVLPTTPLLNLKSPQ